MDPGEVMDILIVDDQRALVESISRGLRIRGHRPLGTYSGEMALELIAEQGLRPELILTDYNMGGIDGVTLTRILRSHSIPVPIILMTAHGSIELHEKAAGAGCDAVLEKPFYLKELSRVLRKVVRRKLKGNGKASRSRADLLMMQGKHEGEMPTRYASALLDRNT